MDEEKSQEPAKQTKDSKNRFLFRFFRKSGGQSNKKDSQNKIKEYLDKSRNFISTPKGGMVILTAFLALFAWQQNSTHRKQLRAYIVIEEPELGYPQPPDVGRRIEMTFVIRNDGQTPAYDVRDSLYLEIRSPDDRPLIMPIETRSFNHPVYGSGIPQKRIVHSGKQIFTKEHAKGFRTGDFRVFFWGRIEYTDIFDCRHWTTFCYEYGFEWSEFRPYGKCHDGD